MEVVREKIVALCDTTSEKFFSQFGFSLKDASLDKIIDYMYKPKDSSSLAVTRILFGLAMLFDIPDERGGADMNKRWGDTNICHFPLLPFLRAIPMPYMAIVYTALWFGAIGIMLGFKYRISAVVFTLCYWYLFLIDKSFWNNHSYLFGLVALLLSCTEANCYWSIDALQDPSKLKTTVPYWNYFILKYQFFILYFMAGMKKGTAEWLTGYSVQNLSEHWVFEPFKLFLTVPQIDYLVVHLFVFVFDLTIAMWMMYAKTRHIAMTFCALFHLMNSRLFRIGMFPWVCLATMPLFYPFDWPKILLWKMKLYGTKIKAVMYGKNDKDLADKVNDYTLTTEEKDLHCENYINTDDKEIKTDEQTEEWFDEDDVFNDTENVEETKEETAIIHERDEENSECRYKKKKLTLLLILFHVVSQAFLPYSHFLTKGYNNWTNGLYGYSWDMMVHSWDIHAVIVRIVDNEKNSEFFIDPYFYTPNDRWTRHGDMVHQYAKCLNENLMEKRKSMDYSNTISKNISIYFDVWCSMNGRFTQRHFDPKADMLKVDWSPFTSMSYLMPLLDEALAWRNELDVIRQHVNSLSNSSDVVFLADFPGYEQEKYISSDLINITLTVLKGEVGYEPQVAQLQHGNSYKLLTGEKIDVETDAFHKVLNIGDTPVYYMYTFYNRTLENVTQHATIPPKLPISKEIFNRINKWFVFANLLLKNVVQSAVLFGSIYIS